MQLARELLLKTSTKEQPEPERVLD